MKRLVYPVILYFILTSFSFSGQIWWNNPTPNYWVDRFTNMIPASSDWLVAMHDSGDNSVVYSRTNGWFAVGPTSGYFFVAINPTQGTFNVYTRIYNSSAIGSATWYSDVGPATNRIVGPIDTWQYYLPANSGGDWVMIPEPGTVSLFALGLLTMAVKRRLKSKRE